MACLTVVPAKDFRVVLYNQYSLHGPHDLWVWRTSLHKVPKPYEVIWRA